MVSFVSYKNMAIYRNWRKKKNLLYTVKKKKSITNKTLSDANNIRIYFSKFQFFFMARGEFPHGFKS